MVHTYYVIFVLYCIFCILYFCILKLNMLTAGEKKLLLEWLYAQCNQTVNCAFIQTVHAQCTDAQTMNCETGHAHCTQTASGTGHGMCTQQFCMSGQRWRRNQIKGAGNRKQEERLKQQEMLNKKTPWNSHFLFVFGTIEYTSLKLSDLYLAKCNI